ncbi:hypothetical protein [Salinimicrobium gaetbulicola]|uniref:Uncharacterized protein n=1 Tax=Salinimicrobium gaetbulicola TaxID=999702 RepID=A0ABW3IG34_9FLAO
MNKRIFLLIFSVVTISCKSQNHFNYSKGFSDCLSNKDIELLDKATQIFEQKLSEYYGGKNANENFMLYLKDSGSIPPSLKPPKFYYNHESLEIIQELKRNGTYEKIWRDYDPDDSSEDNIEIIQLDGSDEPERKPLKMAFLDPNGDYLDCIKRYYSNKPIKEVLIIQSEHGDIATSVIASVLKKQLKEKDFENGLNKVIVAISSYYEMTILLKNNPKP